VKKTLERELKLEADADFALPELGGTAIEPRLFTSVYYDTPGRRLLRGGITLRRRTENGKSLWQLKLPRAGARLELEEPGGPGAPPPRILELLAGVVRHAPLRQLAELRTRREGVTTEDAEITVDAVTILDGQRAAGGFREVEVELHETAADRLAPLRKKLLRAGARPHDGRVKLERAIGTRDGSRVPRTAPAVEHVRASFAAQYEAILRHDPGVRLGDDPEDLHDVRVAVRRLRAVLRAAGPLLEEAWAADLRGRLGDLGRMLGPPRDADVLLARLREESADLEPGERAAFEVLLRRLESEREQGREAMLAAMRSDGYGVLLDDLEAAASELRVVPSDIGIEDVAAKAFRKLRRSVRKLPDEPTDDELHRTRILAKRARYAAELLAPSSRRAAKFVDRAKEFQDVVGEHQDAVVAVERLRELSVDAHPLAAVAVGRLIEREGARRRAMRDAFPDTWRKLERAGKRAFA
jgi:CHAD domain-containing protein